MPPQKVLICGAGVAGSILAFWLAKSDFEVVVVERAHARQKLGQGVEIEEPALKVVKAMGVLDELNRVRTGERGFNLVDERSRSYGLFEAGYFSPTGALEIMRGDLVEVLYKAANESANVTYLFETTIQSLKQTSDKVIADLENRNGEIIRTEEFDYVVGADGIKSRTRQMVMGSPEKLNCLKPIPAFVAFFSIPKEDQDWPYSRLCHFPDRRILWTRPIGKESKMTSVALIYLRNDVPSLRQANATGDRVKQKEGFSEIYSGLKWETPRIIEQMMKAENFYAEQHMQVKLPRWSQDRVVLVGDAAWAPSAITGEGNQLAIIGAWVLAQELSRKRSVAAFDSYEKRLRSYVESCQSIPLFGYAPWIGNPQTIWGIWLLRMFFLFLSWMVRFGSWVNLAKILPDWQQDGFNLEM